MILKNWLVMLIINFLLIITSQINTQAQNFCLPAIYLDSLLFEAERGRACEKVIVAQSNQIEVMGRQLIAYEGAKEMQTRQLLTADSLLRGKDKEILLVQERGEMLLKEEKKKKRKWIIISVLGIVAAIVK